MSTEPASHTNAGSRFSYLLPSVSTEPASHTDAGSRFGYLSLGEPVTQRPASAMGSRWQWGCVLGAQSPQGQEGQGCSLASSEGRLLG